MPEAGNASRSGGFSEVARQHFQEGVTSLLLCCYARYGNNTASAGGGYVQTVLEQHYCISDHKFYLPEPSNAKFKTNC